MSYKKACAKGDEYSCEYVKENWPDKK